jgi:hypothetical protein
MRMRHRRALERGSTIRVGPTPLLLLRRHPIHHGTLLSPHHPKLHLWTRLLLLLLVRTQNAVRLLGWWSGRMDTHPSKVHRRPARWHPLAWLALLTWLEVLLRGLATHTRVHADAIGHGPIDHVRGRRTGHSRLLLHISGAWGHAVNQTVATHLLLRERGWWGLLGSWQRRIA